MAFTTEGQVLRHFMDGGDMLDVDGKTMFIADCNGDGEFFGIMVAGVPEGHCGSVRDAVEYAVEHFPAPGARAENRMLFMEAPGRWFSKLASVVLNEPSRFIVTSCE